MGIYLYGFIRSSAPGTSEVSGTGVDGGAVSLLRHRGLAAVVSEVAEDAFLSPPVRRLRRDIAAHADVLAGLVEHATVLPMPFGCLLPDEQTVVREILDPQHEALAEELQRLDGAVEISFKAAYIEEAVLSEILQEEPDLQRQPAGARGTLFDDRLALGEHVAWAVREKKEVDAARLLERLSPHAREVVTHEIGMDLLVLQGSFLIERGRMEEFDRAVNRLNAEMEHRMRIACVGPLPAYSFVRLQLALPAQEGMEI